MCVTLTWLHMQPGRMRGDCVVGVADVGNAALGDKPWGAIGVAHHLVHSVHQTTCACHLTGCLRLGKHSTRHSIVLQNKAQIEIELLSLCSTYLRELIKAFK